MSRAQPTILVIIGVTGDLSARKLLPAIEGIVAAGAAPEQLRVLGITRQNHQVADVLARLPEGANQGFLQSHLYMHQMDLTDLEAYQQLGNRLAAMEREMGISAQRLFYLSVPPQISPPVVALLGQSGLAAGEHTKLLLEKPFGVDLASAQELIEQTKRHFDESQIYRIDHYVAKEMAQNVIRFRQSNPLFERTWNKGSIAGIEIVAEEQIGIEGRAAFYEQTGALRDVVQSHLLQLAALTLMTPSAPGRLQEVPSLRLQALRQLHVPTGQAVSDYVVRGQYEGYREEVGNPQSMVETYVSVQLQSGDPQWQGVPIHLRTGKALAGKRTEIRITYKKDQAHHADQLLTALQSDEGASLHRRKKAAGYEWRVEDHALQLAFKDNFAQLPDPYGQVFLEAINTNHTLFTSSDEVLETWRILEPVQTSWQFSDEDLVLYPRGSEGPKNHMR